MDEIVQAHKAAVAGKRPVWLLWSLATIVLWGAWGLVSKVASDGASVYMNQLLYTAGLTPLLIFVAWTVGRQSQRDKTVSQRDETAIRRNRRKGAFWAFLTGILGGLGNIAFFVALGKGGEASIVAPVTALFPMVTVLLAVVFLRERLRWTQWTGLALAFAAIYLLSA
ncbi:MAG TPA: DMT family transporter [Terracidiphilus sp.]|jgi:transporter family protein|nr:DMT family transporter [Terracidiphilus sp.]